MYNFAVTLNSLFPYLSFYWMGGRFFMVGRPHMQRCKYTGRFIEAFEELGYLVRDPHCPVWTAFTEDERRDWEWSSRRMTAPAALKDLLKHNDVDGHLGQLDLESVAVCMQEEERIGNNEGKTIIQAR